jgi:O-antigen/teichoic acid export membrane protein
MTRLHLSFIFSGIEKYSSLVISLITTAIVARVLKPDEIGVFSMGAAIIIVAEALRDFGASVYLVQERNITRDDIRTTFTLMLGMSVLAAILLNVLADPFVVFYSEPRLEPVIRIASISLIFGAFAAPVLALLRREMAFGSVAIVNLVGVGVNTITTLLMIAYGLGYLSLVLASVASSFAVVCAAISIHRQMWIFKPSLRSWRKVIGFGGYASATTILNILFQILPQMLLGRLIGFTAVGIYSRAVMLNQLPERMIINAFQPVILPALAAEVRAGRDLKIAYLRGLTLLTAVQWPALLCLTILAEPVVQLLLGSQWGEVTPLLQLMALASLMLFPAPLTYPTLVSLGRIKDTFKGSLISLPLSTVILLATVPFGLKAIAASLFFTAPLQIYVAISFIQKRIPLSWGEIFTAVHKSGLVALCAAIPAVISVMITSHLPPVVTLALSMAGAAGGWTTALVIVNHPLLAEMRLLMGTASSAVAIRIRS